ncbi:MAG: pyridoxal phosphate-dependent aminotransferase [Patescibacteria group bacterium]|nr:pyridoxal phosphate-dependent aminotransferase [Patescibacteria group bacterium]
MRTNGISKRGREIPESPLRLLISTAQLVEKTGRQVYYLNLGEPDEFPPQSVSLALADFASRKIKYGQSSGEPELISAWQKYYNDFGVNISTDEIIVTTGASEAILFSLAAVADPGDEVLVFEPFYPNYLSIATLLGLKLRSVSLVRSRESFRLPPFENLRQQVTDKTRAIIFDNPSNPSGYVYSREELASLGRLAAENNLALIVDEVYRELVYEGRPTSILQFPEFKGRVIMLDSVSKRYSLCGCRIGCLVSRDQEIMTAVRHMCQSRLSAPVPSQRAAISALAYGQDYIKSYVETFRARREMVTRAFGDLPGAEYIQPTGAFYAFIKIPKLDNSEKFCRWLVSDFAHRNQTVVVAPGTGFYLKPEDGRLEFRLAFVLENDKLNQALTILREGITQYLKQLN